MLEKINSILCGVLLPFLILAVGIFLLARLKGFYILHPIRSARRVLCASGGFRPLCVALAGTLGVGNIVGVASAISMGGAGSVFWMIISALVAMGVKYAESYLAVRHRRGVAGAYYGGASYYIADSCKSKRTGAILGGIFSVLCVFNSLSTGNLVQINSISPFAKEDKRLLLGIAIAFVVFIIILGGEKRIQDVSAVLIPVLTVLYVILSLYIIFSNFEALCVSISRIFEEAFSVKSAVSGAFGFGMAQAMRYGFSRGLLSNEAGCGTSTIAHASSSADAHSQGCLGIFEVFWDTIVLCTLTALVILISGKSHQEPIMLAISAYGSFTGIVGELFIAISCVLFALATVSCQYYYGNRALSFVSSSRLLKGAYFIIFFSVCILSSILANEVMWHISDFICATLAIYNMVFLLKLSREIK